MNTLAIELLLLLSLFSILSFIECDITGNNRLGRSSHRSTTNHAAKTDSVSNNKPFGKSNADKNAQLPTMNRARSDRLNAIRDRRARRSSPESHPRDSKDDKLTHSLRSQFMRYIMEQEGDLDVSRGNNVAERKRSGDRALGTAETADDDYPDPTFSTDDAAIGDDDFVQDFYSGQFCYSPSESYTDFNYSCSADTSILPPPCIANASELVKDSSGQLSSIQTFYQCLANVYDAAEPATFYNGSYHGCLNIYTIMTLLNLVKIDEIDGSVSLQLVLVYVWKDRRFDMPDFWKNTWFGFSGFDVTKPLRHNDSTIVWTPEIVFPDAAEIEIQAEALILDDQNYFWWTVTYGLTLVQPQFDFKEYPNDEQDLVIRFTAPSYDMEEVQLKPIGLVCSVLADGSCAFSHNPIWTWKEDKKYCTTYVDEVKSAYSLWPSFAMYRLTMQRQGSGVIVRLILPLTMLLLLSALTFWISYENRLDTTITLLLSVSALYIVILGNIPMVGYLTNVDTFVCWMFVSLVVVCTSHQVYATLYENADRWPLRLFYLRLIELGGRTFLFPAIMLYFLETIHFISADVTTVLIGTVCGAGGVIFLREIYGVRVAFREAMEKLMQKINDPAIEVGEVSFVETLVVNWMVFGRVSVSMDYITDELMKCGHIHYQDQAKQRLRHWLHKERKPDEYIPTGDKDVKCEAQETLPAELVGNQVNNLHKRSSKVHDESTVSDIPRKFSY